MNGIQIEKGVAMPTRNETVGRAPKYPWSSMQVGDSFLIPKGTKRTSVDSSGRSWSKRNGGTVVFASRKTDEGYRIWRVK